MAGDRDKVRQFDDLLAGEGAPGGVLPRPRASLIPHDLDKRRLAITWVFLVSQVLAWVLTAEMLQYIEHHYYYKPCFMTWFIHNGGMIWLLPWVYWYLKSRSRESKRSVSELAKTLGTFTAQATGVPIKQMLCASFGLSCLIFAVEYFWCAAAAAAEGVR
eukprot:TRINITY_DN6148_c0_g1_i1.p1 TRINITY_DN6148_c0_g1~~TRINITY_DN6148_c0_g1_i1.p1  ORF type:complete len:171 (-),score=43.99 TRINITY_DN6148_c0_g1_i1:815-1294(-)